MKNKIISVLMATVFTVPFLCTSKAGAISFTMKETLHSDSALIMNLDSNVILYEKNPDKKQMPGPLVNIMTAIVCMENCTDLNQKIEIDEDLYSDLYVTDYVDDLRFADIVDGDILTYNDLLYAMILTSSIEASETIAYHIGEESVETFVKMMNDKADNLGLTSTHFTNPTGMYDADQYTTARDMAILTKYALSLPHFEDICSTYMYEPSIPNKERHPVSESWRWFHSNIMMDEESEYYYKGVRGVKTGNLELGGRNIVAMASRDGHNYIAIGMRAPINDSDGNTSFYHLDDATDMFNWAFNHFSYQVVLEKTAELGELPVELADGNDYVLARPKEELSLLWYDDIDVSLISRDNITWYNTKLMAPVNEGEPLGTVKLEYSGEEVAEVELVAVSSVKRSVSKYNFYVAKLFIKSNWFRKAIIIAGLLSLLYIIICVYSYILFKSGSKPVKPKYAVPKVDKPKKKK